MIIENLYIMKRKRFAGLLLTLVWASATAWGQGPHGTGTYYASADGKKGQGLKTELSAIIGQGVKDLGYGGLWNAYRTTDVRADGKIWDMYSSTTSYDPVTGHAGNYRKEGDMYNREHSIPQSWFRKASPMKSDLFHVYPTDGYVNNKRSNYPFGETNGEIYQSNGGHSKLGACTTAGYSGTVFEPADEYKGDFARTYFYMATRYENEISTWGGGVFGHGTYPGIADWALKMFIRWAKNDPVSEKEIKRNNEVYKLQHNRNPFIDYPGLEQFIWGDSVNVVFRYTNSETPPTPPKPNPNPDEPITPPAGTQVFKKVTSAVDLQAGRTYLIVHETGSKALSAAEANRYRKVAPVVINSQTITTETGVAGKPYMLTLGGTDGAYTFYDAIGGKYLSYSGSSNGIYTADAATSTEAQWSITIEADGTALIKSAAVPGRAIFYNPHSPRFACYVLTKGMDAVTLYVNAPVTAIHPLLTTDDALVDVYGIDGRKVRHGVKRSDAFRGLPQGIYIVGGKKYIVR